MTLKMCPLHGFGTWYWLKFFQFSLTGFLCKQKAKGQTYLTLIPDGCVHHNDGDKWSRTELLALGRPTASRPSTHGIKATSQGWTE